MAWIPAAITVAGGVAKSMMDQQNGQKIAAAQPAMELGKMMLQDSSMNNSGWIVTTNGSTANATANTSRTLTPSTSASLSGALGAGSMSGFDMTPLLIAGALFLAFKK